MSDIRRDKPIRRKPQRIEREQHDNAKRPRAYRSQRHRDAQCQPCERGEQEFVTLHLNERSRRNLQTDALQLRLENERYCSNQENDREGARGDRIGRARRAASEPQTDHHRGRSWNASEQESSDDPPVYASAKSEGGGRDEFRGGGKQQIRPHRNRRRLPKQQHQYRRHQRSAAHAGEADHRAD